MSFKRLAAVSLVGVLAAGSAATAQPRDADAERVALGVALRQLNSTGTFMMVTAHPDDENNALLAALAKGAGHRVVLVTATRGDGGQNEIGPELFDGLAVLRTEELLAAHRLDGAEQFFTRAVDFGYSFSLEETFARWGRDEILGDIVRMIRTVRPDVITTLSPEGDGGGQHHQASAVLAHEAYHAAGDPARFPGQLAEGLRAWQATKFYFSSGFPFGFGFLPPGFREPAPDPDLTTVRLDGYDALLGATWAEIGSRARSMHKCQGMSQLVPLPAGAAGARFQLVETTLPAQRVADESSLFDGVDTSIEALAALAGTQGTAALAPALGALAADARRALEQFERDGLAGAREPVVAGLRRVRALRARLGALDLADEARWELDRHLAAKTRQFERAALLAHAVRLEALADDGQMTPGQPLEVSVLAANHGGADVVVHAVRLAGFDVAGAACGPDTVASGAVYTCAQERRIPADARLTDIHWSHVPGADRYAFDPDVPFGVPFRPTPYRAVFDLEVGSERIEVERPVEHRYADDIFTGEKRMTLTVVPRFAVAMTPEIAILPTAGDRTREVRVTVTHTGPGAATGTARLELPAGWRATPDAAPVRFSREDESQTVRFRVTAANAATGEHRVKAVVEAAGARFDRGHQVIEYPHTARRHLGRPAVGRFKLLDVAVASDLAVGYIVGVGDEVPPAIEQLGASLTYLGADDLAWGNLSRFDVIVTGVRAYERRQDLRANNDRLLEYVAGGGTVIVQYNKFEFNDAQYGPYPARVGRDRVTDEAAPVRVLANDHPVFAWPNRIGAATWDDWVQERGLYFLGDRDPTYVDLVELEDSFEYNPGVKRGALVEARHGEGRWLYVGLGLWRQLPAGTTGAYALLANLLSLGARP